MKTVSKQGATRGIVPSAGKSYAQIVQFLDEHWTTPYNQATIAQIKQLDAALGNLLQKKNIILITGSNGKSLTINFTSQLLQAENLTVGTHYSPHITSYNERFSLNKDLISQENFVTAGNKVISIIEELNLSLNSADILTCMALVYFTQQNADVMVLEANEFNQYNALSLCHAAIVGITRATSDNQAMISTVVSQALEYVKEGSHVACADQSKLSLQTMLDITNSKKGVWHMPTRKLAQLNYPLEQLHGRCAALAERIAQIYVNLILAQDSVIMSDSLLTKQKGLRGRPTLEAKRKQELNPRRTIEQFWKETTSTLPGRFQLLESNKPQVLLDNASNLDAFENLLLGIRLLCYERPIKGLVLILGNNNEALHSPEFIKLLRYFFKKTSGQVVICATETQAHNTNDSWNIEKVTNDIKAMKIKARSAKSFAEAFEIAQKSVDDRHGLVVVSGSTTILNEYARYQAEQK